MFFKSNFSYSDSNKSYSDLLLELDSGNIQSIYFYPRKREIDVLYKNGNKEKVPILYNDQLIIELIIRIKPPAGSSLFNLWSIIDKARIGATYAVILEAFKLGS